MCMTKNKLLTISIAAYNAENYLEKCLSSFLDCKMLHKLELLVIDDGSTDNTANIALKYVAEYPDVIKLISKENGGHGSTINASIKEATGKYYKVVDSDDWISSQNLDSLLLILNEVNHSLIMNPYYEIYANDSLNKKLIFPFDFELKGVYSFDSVADRLKLAMHAMTIRTDILKKMGPIIDENCFYVDTEYSVFPVEFFVDVLLLDFPIYNYLLGTLTQSMNMKNMQNRVEQHYRVSKRLVEYFEKKKNELSSASKNVIKKRITSVLIMQYVVWLTMNPRVVKNEILNFDKWLKSNSCELYDYVPVYAKTINSGYMKVISLCRFIDYNGYELIINTLQALKIIKV